MSEKQKFELEFIVKTSPSILFKFFVSSNGLSDWFADEVNVQNDLYIFKWEGAEDRAKMVDRIKDEYVKYQWLEDEGTDYYFAFHIDYDSLTRETAVTITDFSESGEKEEAILLWETQFNKLKRVLGL